MHPPVPFAAQYSTRPEVCVTSAQVYGTLSRFLGRLRTIEQTSTLTVQVTKLIGLKLIRENTEQQMAGQVRWCSPTEDCLPSGSKVPDIETAKSRNLDVECLSVRWCTTDLYARHDAQAARRLAWRGVDSPISLLEIW